MGARLLESTPIDVAKKSEVATAAGARLGALGEVLLRIIPGSEPVSELLIVMGLVALMANVTSLFLDSPKKERGAHMKASYIFFANDVIVNLVVIIAGGLVAWTGSPNLIS
ncbi:hypothetical protein MJO47_14715 [Desulfuromonas sp. KJ2020]|uniref:hypothetical protein n=1 Tax=Desulfuromonas sp. KJ2020 TaxID=2919173 RepID=UPI0020A6ED38|nr:hypothetical protein [Desulfuromonas sp. KJ2020]MCP3178355.1 hypothetical protein [Desulfuromonas sp. KJ2020]